MTPAIVELQRAGVRFEVHEFVHDPADAAATSYGTAAARALGVEADRVFKTLLADATFSGGVVHQVVGIVPVTAQLSMKEIALAVGAKRAEMCAPATAERITGYVVGGISPFGQKKRLRSIIDETCELSETIFVSGGRRGLDLEIAPAALVGLLQAEVAAIAVW